MLCILSPNEAVETPGGRTGQGACPDGQNTPSNHAVCFRIAPDGHVPLTDSRYPYPVDGTGVVYDGEVGVAAVADFHSSAEGEPDGSRQWACTIRITYHPCDLYAVLPLGVLQDKVLLFSMKYPNCYRDNSKSSFHHVVCTTKIAHVQISLGQC